MHASAQGFRKKLQIFVSSTYTDLIEERQAAVQAILEAGHIPAGMELFAAGDETQMKVIRRWIDESDVYLLILGTRYGSVEPASRKSYTHLEYEYAVATKKPRFAVVLDPSAADERRKTAGRKGVDPENPLPLRKFVKQVTANAIVKFWKTSAEIKLAIFQTLPEFARRPEIKGWVPGDQAVNVGPLAEEVARLSKENAELRKILAEAGPEHRFDGLTFDELKRLLVRQPLGPDWLEQSGQADQFRAVQQELQALGVPVEPPNLFHFFWLYFLHARLGNNHFTRNDWQTVTELQSFGLTTTRAGSGWELSPTGHRFALRLRLDLARAATTSPTAPTAS